MKKAIYILLVTVLVFGIVGIGIAFWYNNGNLKEIIVDRISDKIVTEINKSADSNEIIDNKNIFNEALGFHGVKNYLVLLLNNTELRPGGGFIGAYAVIQVDKGIPTILKFDGTENLYNDVNKIKAPQPIEKYLGLKTLEFRDSNWSPDFASSSIQSLLAYSYDNGLMADKIDAVIGFTPTLFEEILKITGPFTYGGIEFNSENFTKELEYEVEYNFKTKDIDFTKRKGIMEGIMKEMMKKLVVDVFFKWDKYFSLTNKMVEQKHIMFYSANSSTQKIIEYKKAGGNVKSTKNDYLLWVDANLGALKTDVSINRELAYSFKPISDDKYLAKVKMKYIHSGVFDWRTTRYRTYARIYVPTGSEFVSVNLNNVKGDKVVDKGEELDKQWFGTFVSIEPQTTGEIEYEFYLSKDVVEKIKKGEYSLSVQKQLGTIKHELSLDLDFGKQVIYASLGEDTKFHGDNKYNYATDLIVDREFSIKLK